MMPDATAEDVEHYICRKINKRIGEKLNGVNPDSFLIGFYKLSDKYIEFFVVS
jgi:hypothetical protein